MLDATEHILQIPDGTARFTQFVTKLSQAFGLANPHEEASRIRDEVALFQAIQSRLLKLTRKERKQSDEDIESAIRKIVSKALISESVIDVFDAAGLKNPEISILSDDFLQEIKNMKRKNSALELLKRLLSDELKVRAKTNIVQSKKFSERLKDAVIKYQNNLLSTAEIIEEMMIMAKEMREADKRGEQLDLAPEELAFFDALSENESAKEVLGDEILKDLALVLAEQIRKNTTIDWTKKESVRAKLRVLIKRTLRKFGYPPKFEKGVVEQILKQSEMMADGVME
jgi:type I restriction enzyme R subunit